MSKKGHYPGGHTVLGPSSSSWFSNAKQAKRQGKLLQSGERAYAAFEAKAAVKAANKQQAVQQRLEREGAKQKARLEARRGEMQRSNHSSSGRRMENVIVVRKGKSGK